MKKATFVFVSMLLMLAMAQPALAQLPLPDDTKPLPPAEKSAATTDAIIVKFRAPEQAPSPDTPQANSTMQALNATAMDALSAAAGVALAYERPMSGEAHVLRLPNAVSQREAQTMADSIAQLPQVEYASPVIHMQAMQVGPEGATATPNDPQYSAQWHYFAPTSGNYGINLPPAWGITTGMTNAVVAVLDTGIRFDHPDFAGRTLPGYDFISDPTYINDGNARDADASDPGDACPPSPRSSWHGTHVAGTIGAASNNGIGVAGVNWVSKILPVRVLGKCGNDDPDIIDAVRWAAGMPVSGVPNNTTPARVINLSLGGDGSCTPAWQSAINDVMARGVVVVVAAGNSNANAANATPANCNGVIAVGATLRNGKRTSYSNYGSVVTISAPGGICAGFPCTTSDTGGILSTYNAGTTTPSANTYNYLDGTSMATPHVAGVASLMLSVNPFLSPAQVLGIMQNTATPFPGGRCDDVTPTKTCGAGIVNAGAAVVLAKGLLNITPRIFVPLVGVNVPGGTIANGGFEAGAVDWLATSAANPEDPLIYAKGGSPSLPTALTPHGGTWTAWMGGYAAGVPEDASLRQTMTVPAGKPYFVFYQIVYGGETNCANDYMRVLVNGTEVAGSRVGVCNAPAYGAWVKRSLNLSAYAGQQITLAFAFRADSSTHSPASSVFIDDVSFSTTP
jgi:serine protease